MKLKISTLSLILSLMILAGCGSWFSEETPEQRAAELRKSFSWEKGSPPMISAHRGSPSAGFPENSLSAFQRAFDMGSLIIECDVRSTRDGFLVLMHDETLDRTTTGSGYIHEKDLRDLKELYLLDPDGNRTPQHIPLLGEVLDWAAEGAVLTLDIKAVEPTHILSVIARHKAEDRVIIIVYNYVDMMKYHALAPHLMISVSAGSPENIEKLLSYPIPKDRLLVFTGVSEPKPGVYDIIHENGMYTILGTMHNLDNKAEKDGIGVYQALYRNGADILSTDRVDLVSAAIRDMKKY